MSAMGALMTRLIDYAGLFPPAKFEMRKAVANYREYLAGESAWALGRFLVPAVRLPEFVAVFNDVCCEEREWPWAISVLVSDNASEDAKRIAEFAQGAVLIEAVEMKAATAGDVAALLDVLPAPATAYVEIAPESADEILPALAGHRARAKLRTGGVTPEAFPESAAVAHFLVACAKTGVPFKATAGLHHAVRGMYRITHEETSPWARMHGFVNVFLAAAYAYGGKDEPFVLALLEEDSPAAIHVEEDAIIWRGQRISADEIEKARREFAIGFGSCSFAEPMDELKALGWR